MHFDCSTFKGSLKHQAEDDRRGTRQDLEHRSYGALEKVLVGGYHSVVWCQYSTQIYCTVYTAPCTYARSDLVNIIRNNTIFVVVVDCWKPRGWPTSPDLPVPGIGESSYLYTVCNILITKM